MTSERSDRHMVAAVAQVGQVAEPADVDEHRRHGEPQLHQREQRHAAGDELRLVAVLGEQGQRGVGGIRALVLERGGDHGVLWAAASTARTMLW